jgi:hypothetical protein
MGALAVQLTEADLRETDARFSEIKVTGDRYAADLMKTVNR